ncbi:MAG: PH domain-containing protein, partial [Porphyromonadaceae bacterium]|nr:PH domain-containing protein [Porphyromonadaceae bacterium]
QEETTEFLFHSLRRTHVNILYRLLDLEGLVLDSVASTTEEVTLLLPNKQAEALRQWVQEQEHLLDAGLDPSSEALGSGALVGIHASPLEATPVAPSLSSVDLSSTHGAHDLCRSYRYSLRQIIGGALMQNHLRGFVYIWVIFSFVFNQLSDLDLSTDTLAPEAVEWVGRQVEVVEHEPQTLSFLLLLVGGYIIGVLLLVGRHIYLNYDAEVKVWDDRVEWTGGLVTTMHKAIRFSKIITFTIKRNYLERYFKTSSVGLGIADRALDTKNREAGLINLNAFADYDRLLYHWGGSREWIIPKLHARVGLLYTRLLFWLVVSLATLALLWDLGSVLAGAVVGVLILFVGTLRSYGTYKYSGVAATSRHLVVSSGALAEIDTWIPIERIERMRITQAPWQRHTGGCTLKIDTMGRDFVLRSLGKAEVEHLIEVWIYLSKSSPDTLE